LGLIAGGQWTIAIVISGAVSGIHLKSGTGVDHPSGIIIIIIIIIQNLYSAIMPLGGYRGDGVTGR